MSLSDIPGLSLLPGRFPFKYKYCKFNNKPPRAYKISGFRKRDIFREIGLERRIGLLQIKYKNISKGNESFTPFTEGEN